MGGTQPIRQEKERKVFFGLSWNFSFENLWINYFFILCIDTWHVNIYVSRQGKVLNWKKRKYHFFIPKIVFIVGLLCLLRLVPYFESDNFLILSSLLNYKPKLSHHHPLAISLQEMATLRNKGNCQPLQEKAKRNTSNPRINEDYKTQVFEEIECKVTKIYSRKSTRQSLSFGRSV